MSRVTESKGGPCEHELAWRRCGGGIGELSLTATEAEDAEAEAIDRAVNEELAEQLVSCVRVEPYGGVHEGVTVWLRGANVGTLTVGDGEGRLLRHLLLSEDIVRKAKALALDWHMQDGFNASRLDDLVLAFETTDRLARLTEENGS